MPPGPDRRADLLAVADECVNLVDDIFGHRLDYSLDSLKVLDQACSLLMEDGPLSDQRLTLWYQLAGAYTGEVCLRAYGGEWIEHEGSNAIVVLGLTGFPFSTAHRLLSGEDGKSLASFARSIPAVVEHSRKKP